jgi:hypothetical protein
MQQRHKEPRRTFRKQDRQAYSGTEGREVSSRSFHWAMESEGPDIVEESASTKTEELLEAVFSVRSTQKLYNKGRLRQESLCWRGSAAAPA